MRMRNLRGALRFLLLVSALCVAGEAMSQSYFFTLSGAPSSVTCTTTSVSWSTGTLGVRWNLPSGSQAYERETAGAMVVYENTSPVPDVGFPASGTISGIANTSTWPTPLAMPYTYTYSFTSLYPGGTTSTYSLDCVGGVGTNLRISNGATFTTATIPTLGAWALAALIVILAASSLLVLRRRRAV